jgi:hypothetical protein
MAVINPKALVASQQLTNSNATYYTATNTRAIIDKMTLCNTTGGPITATIDLVDSGGSAGVTERIISARSLAAGETYTCPEAVGHILNAGDTIQGLASANTSITIRVSGREVTGI